MMLNTEVLWNKALTDNNIKGLVGCLRGLCAEGEGDTSECLARFNCWLQSSAELAKKELLMLCFGRCKGLWMFVDENSVALVHKLVLKLKNLLSLVHLVKKQSEPLHSKQGSRASYIWGCWKQEHHAMRQHILLGRLVQWWSITGLLPKYPEAHELKRISQMWREMDHKQRRTCLQLSYAEDKYRWSSLIQGMVAHMDKQHGPIWVSEDCAYQMYPPPSLEALLKLVLLPNIDMVSVQAIVMYFVLDVSNFLQCEDDLLQSFCHVFSIPSAFSQQILGFWLLDHGLVTDSMDVLLSPRACPPALSWNHCAVLRTLLRTGENQAALKYLYSITPAMENIHDIKLCVDVLIQNKCISAAWALLRGLHTEDVHLFKHFIHVCENCGICSHTLATLCEGMAHLHLTESQNMQFDKSQILNQETIGQRPVRPEPGHTPRPLSAWLYQTDDRLTPGDFVRILRQSISEICPLPKKRRLLSTLNLHPNCYSNEDKYSSNHSIPEIPMESHNLLSPNHEKFIYHKTADDAVSIKPKNRTETEEWIISPREPKTEYEYLQDSDSVEASGTPSFLELKPLGESQEGFCRDPEDAVDQPEILTSCGFTDMHDVPAHLQQTDLSADDGEPYQACSLRALKGSIMDLDLSLIRLSQPSRQLQNPIGSHSRLARTPQLSLSQQRRHSESRVSSTQEVCFRAGSERVGHCKRASWWKQALETGTQIPALEQGSPVTPAVTASSIEQRTSPDPRRPPPHGLGSFLDFPSNPQVEKREVQQAVKGELTGRRVSFKMTINQMDHGSTSHRGRRGKTSKRIKRA